MFFCWKCWRSPATFCRPSKCPPSGTYTLSFGSNGSGQGQFTNPIGVAVSNGEVYVSDQNNNRIQVFCWQIERQLSEEENKRGWSENNIVRDKKKKLIKTVNNMSKIFSHTYDKRVILPYTSGDNEIKTQPYGFSSV